MGESKSMSDKGWKEKRAKELGVDKDPGNWFYYEDPRGKGKKKVGRQSDWFPFSLALEVADIAKKYNLPFTDVFSTFITETGGTEELGDVNPGHVLINKHEKELVNRYPALSSINYFSPRNLAEADSLREILMDYSGKLLKDAKTKYPEDEIKAFQEYSGKGNLLYGGKVGGTPVFGGVPANKVRLRDPNNPAYLAQGWEKYLTSTFLRDLIKPEGPLHGVPEEQRSYNQPKLVEPTVWDKTGLNKILPFLSELLGIK